MPDQLPSAILDGTNSFDSIFALELDTKQRFDNILTNQQKPIDYPIPDYNKDLSPRGLPQDELLNPVKMKGSLGEALFSTDPRVAAYATDKLRQSQSNLPVSQGFGVPDRFQYSKEMDKFLKGDYGYNPYLSMEDNEDFNYRYDYMSHTFAGRVLRNLGTGLTRFTASVGLKLGQSLGYLGSMIWNGVEEIFDGKRNNFMADVADNSMSRWFEGLEENMKTSNLLSVFKPRGWEDKGFFQKLGNGAFWTDEVADGAAFMGEMVASMYLLGGLGKIGAIGRLGSTQINLSKALGKLGPIGKYTGKSVDAILKTATGAENLSGIGRWAFATASESAFESSQLFHSRKDELKAERQAGKNEFTDAEIEIIAGDSAAASFKANMLVLSASNAFENKFIFNPLFKKLGARAPNPRGRLISINQGTNSVEELAQAARREYKYSTWLGKKLNWRDSNGRLRFYGSRALSATAAEGLWEENAQLAIERLASVDNLSFNTFAQKITDQTIGAFDGSDPEAQTNIGLGALIGIGGTGAVSKIRGGNKLFQGERKAREEDTRKAIQIYEEQRRNFLSFQDIYIRDAETNKPVLDADGNLQIDELKAAAVLDGMNALASKQEAASKVYDPLFRKFLQDNAMMDFVAAAKNAGIYDRSAKRLSSLGDLTVTELENLGFDPNTTVDTVYLRDSLKKFGELYEKVEKAPAARLGKNDTIQDELSRKHALYKASATVYSTTKILGEFQSAMLDRDFPSVFSPEAEGNTSEIQQYNSLVFQKEALDQWAELAKENGNFYNGYISSEKRRIDAEMARLEQVMDDMMDNTNVNIETTPRGFLVSTDKYSHLTPTGDEVLDTTQGAIEKRTIKKLKSNRKFSKAMVETDMNMDIEYAAQRKHAQMTNERARHQYLVNKFGSIQDGINNYKDYMEFMDSIQKKDAKQDGPAPTEAAPSTQTPAAPAVTTPAQTQEPAARPAPASLTKTEILSADNVIIGLTNLLTQNRALFILNDPSNLPDYTVIATFIEQNVVANRAAVEKVLNDFIRGTGEIVMSQISGNTFKPENLSVETFKTDSRFMDALLNEVQDNDVKDNIFDYMTSVDDAIDNYSPANVTLTDAEDAASRAILALDIAPDSAIAPYTNIIVDPNSSPQDVKNALKDLSDQYYDATDRVGEELGRAASEALEALYPAPEKTETIETLQQGAVAPTATVLEAMKADIERRRQEALNSITQETKENDYFEVGTWYAPNQGVADEFYGVKTKEELIDALNAKYDAELATLEPEGAKEQPEPVPAQQQGGEYIPLPPLVRLPLEVKISDRFIKRFPAEIKGMDTKKLSVLALIGEQEEDESLDDSYYEDDAAGYEEDKLKNEFGEEVNDLAEYLDIRLTKAEAEFLKNNPEFTKALYEYYEDSELSPSEVAQMLLDENSQVIDTYQLNLFTPPAETEEGSGVPEQGPPAPPTPPTPPENSDEASLSQENFIDVIVDESKLQGKFTFVQTMPAEVVMADDKAKIVNGAIQLKTSSSEQLLRQHNILKVMGEKTNPVNFWSEDEEGNPLYKVRLEIAGIKNEAKYTPWVYNTAKGLTNPKTGKLYQFPYIVAMVVDQNGNYVNFDNNGNISNKGMPFGFWYGIEDYDTNYLDISRKGAQLGSMESLNGSNGFLTDDPLTDLKNAIQRGIDITGTINIVTSGKLSTYNVDNQGSTWAKTPQQRTVEQMEKDGDISDNTPLVLKSGQYYEYSSTTTPGAQTQKIKMGQPFLYDEKSGLYIPLRGKMIKDLTVDGKPFIEGKLKEVIESLSKDGKVFLPEDMATGENVQLMENLFNMLRAIVYSQNTPIFINDAKTEITLLDKRPTNKSLMETEINYSTNINILTNPFEAGSEGFSYDEFVRENFLSGAVPAEVTKGQKNFEKLNRRAIFTLDKDHQQILDAIGSKVESKTSIRVKATDFSKFVNKTYRKKGGTSTITVTGYADGKFTITGPSGTTTQTIDNFMKSLRGLEEVKLPAPTEEVQQDFENNIKLSQDEQKETNEQAKTMKPEDLKNIDFNNC